MTLGPLRVARDVVDGMQSLQIFWRTRGLTILWFFSCWLFAAVPVGAQAMRDTSDRVFWTASAAQVGIGLYDAWGQTKPILQAGKGVELVPTTAANIERFGLDGAMWAKTAMHVGAVAGLAVVRAKYPRTRWGTALAMVTMAGVNGAVVVWNEHQLWKAGLR